MTSWDERDSADLARRRSLLSLPMIPLRRDARRWLQPEGWPDMGRWVYDPVAVGVGPDGRVLSLVRDRERGDRLLLDRTDAAAPPVVLDGAVDATFVQPLPGGRVLLVAARARRRETNAQVWDTDGRLVTAGFVGDAIEHVLTTPAGAVWIAYFDEASDDISTRRLVRFDEDLHIRWSYPGSERGLPGLFDVYALNVSGEAAVCYAYTEFHLVRAEGDAATDLGATGVTGAAAVLVDGDRGAFVGGYGADFDVVTPFRLCHDGIEVGEPLGRLVMPDGRELRRRRLTARGGELHVVGEHRLLRQVSLDDLLDGPRH
ncbi:hypothetical protein ACFO3K_13215 [Cellulomonas algicola]|uniref:Uncharacterized protein n=1 Tax=Cellulomonas algicola TaxID=2071633 RepID=A0A401V0L1_9CELL|nr:hypothetical protein [Cellulomonas algicola]GCD20452.1 hypothetical protein CTKZ_20140 [Cellulomonas algicola]